MRCRTLNIYITRQTQLQCLLFFIFSILAVKKGQREERELKIGILLHTIKAVFQ